MFKLLFCWYSESFIRNYYYYTRLCFPDIFTLMVEVRSTGRIPPIPMFMSIYACPYYSISLWPKRSDNVRIYVSLFCWRHSKTYRPADHRNVWTSRLRELYGSITCIECIELYWPTGWPQKCPDRNGAPAQTELSWKNLPEISRRWSADAERAKTTFETYHRH